MTKQEYIGLRLKELRERYAKARGLTIAESQQRVKLTELLDNPEFDGISVPYPDCQCSPGVIRYECPYHG